MFTGCPIPRLCVNVMFCCVATRQVTAVFGAVTATPPDTVNEIVVLRVRLPLTPVIVIGYVPLGVLAPVVTESVDDAVAGFGVKLALASAGNPLTLSATVSVNVAVG